jgi:CubicO group peptidase (beta-lactamase class C family)
VSEGAVTLIAHHGKVVRFEAHGYLDAGKTKLMPQDAVFRVFSITRPFVSVVTMMLVEQDRMKLSDPIATWIPECKDMKVLMEKQDVAGNVTREQVPAERPITVQDLLRHTSGFTYAGNAPFPELKEAYNTADIESQETDVSADGLVQRLASIPLAWQPGTRWHYGVSTDVLGGPPRAPDRQAA